MREFTTFMTPMEDYLRPYVDCFTAEDTRPPKGLLKCLYPSLEIGKRQKENYKAEELQ
jgi:hypothetical protein